MDDELTVITVDEANVGHELLLCNILIEHGYLILLADNGEEKANAITLFIFKALAVVIEKRALEKARFKGINGEHELLLAVKAVLALICREHATAANKVRHP